MEDKDIPEEITLESLLKKANVEPYLYKQALKLMNSGIQITLQRQPSERWINQYNLKVVHTWCANMDLQYHGPILLYHVHHKLYDEKRKSYEQITQESCR